MQRITVTKSISYDELVETLQRPAVLDRERIQQGKRRAVEAVMVVLEGTLAAGDGEPDYAMLGPVVGDLVLAPQAIAEFVVGAASTVARLVLSEAEGDATGARQILADMAREELP